MTHDPPLVDLVVVGGLTIDRFPDGSSAPGGSVVHIARAGSDRGLRVGVVAAAGTEAEARLGVDDLRRNAAWVICRESGTTATFRHRETALGRHLWLEQTGGPVRLGAAVRDRLLTRAVLFAPVAGEVAPSALETGDHPWARGANLQGWLRSTDVGEIRTLRLSDLDSQLVKRLQHVDLLVASGEDLQADAAEPRAQVLALRSLVGDGPALVVTDGVHGVWIDNQRQSPGQPWHVAPGRPVDGISTVGAGDVFAAFMLAGWQSSPSGEVLTKRAARAMEVVADVLESRRIARG